MYVITGLFSRIFSAGRAACIVGALYGWPLLFVLAPSRHSVVTRIELEPDRKASFVATMPEPAARTPRPKPESKPALASQARSVPRRAERSTGGHTALKRIRRTSASRTSPTGSAHRGGHGRCRAENPAITRRGERRYDIDRDLFDRYVLDLSNARRLASVSWHRGGDGRIDGFQVRHLGCVLRQAGFENGDVIRSINGNHVRSLPQAYAVWRRLKGRGWLRVDVLRDGEPIRLRFRVS